MALTANDITAQNFRDFYQQIFPYLNKGNGGLSECPLGMTAFFEDTVAPDGWLVADGSVYDIVDYPDLANHYERVYGSKNHWGGNGTTTFGVPDWQGEFLRASGTNSHTNQGSGGAVGEHQDGTEIPFSAGNATKYMTQAIVAEDAINTINPDAVISSQNRLYYQVQGQDAVGAKYTSRPTNTSLLLCIKAVPSGDLYNYSTNERRVGTWVDGKPLYQKTFVGTGTSTNNTFHKIGDVTTLFPNLDKVINLIATGNSVGGYQSPNFYLAAIETGSENDFIVGQRFGSNTQSFDYRVTIQYTKTTD